MKQSQVDYINFRYLLKGNYRKGVHALRSILADGGQAKAFAENPAAVAVVLSYDKENPDKNAAELYELLTESSVADLASGTYICSTYGVTSFDELFADSDILTTVLADEASMNAVAASSSAMSSLISNDAAFALAAESEVAMAAIAGSAVAVKVVAADAGAMSVVAASNVAMSALTASETGMKIIAGSTTAMTAVAASDNARSIVATSETAMTAITSNSTGLSIIGAHSDFCLAAIEGGYIEALVGDEESMTTCAGSASCVSAILSDSTAMNAVLANDEAASLFVSDPSTSSISAEDATWCGKYIAKLAGADWASIANVAGLMSNTTAMTTVAASAAALAYLVKSLVAKTAFVTADCCGKSYATTIASTLTDTDYFEDVSPSSYLSPPEGGVRYHYNAANLSGSKSVLDVDNSWTVFNSRGSFSGYVGSTYSLIGVGGTSSDYYHISADDSGKPVIPGGFALWACSASCKIYVPK